VRHDDEIPEGMTRRWASAGSRPNPGAIPTNLQKHVGGKLVTPPEKQKPASSTGARIIVVAVSLLMLSIPKMPSDCWRRNDGKVKIA